MDGMDGMNGILRSPGTGLVQVKCAPRKTRENRLLELIQAFGAFLRAPLYGPLWDLKSFQTKLIHVKPIQVNSIQLVSV